MKQELEAKIETEEKVDSTMVVEQEGCKNILEYEVKIEVEEQDLRDTLKEPQYRSR